MTITLKDTFVADDGAVTLGFSIDTDSVFETIKGFVDEYNDMLDTINEKLQEDRYRDYPPLTDKQKEELSEREIELWEEKAKSGLIRNDRLFLVLQILFEQIFMVAWNTGLIRNILN